MIPQRKIAFNVKQQVYTDSITQTKRETKSILWFDIRFPKMLLYSGESAKVYPACTSVSTPESRWNSVGGSGELSGKPILPVETPRHAGYFYRDVEDVQEGTEGKHEAPETVKMHDQMNCVCQFIWICNSGELVMVARIRPDTLEKENTKYFQSFPCSMEEEACCHITYPPQSL